MEPRDSQEHDDNRGHGSRPEDNQTTRNGGKPVGPQIIGTDDPAIAQRPEYDPDWVSHSYRNMAIETSQIRGPNEAFNPHFVMVPMESVRSPRDHSDTPDRANQANNNGNEKARESQRGMDGNARNDASQPRERRNDEPDGSSDRPEGKKFDIASQTHSPTRMLLYSGLVALICGAVGAWGYSYFFGPSKSGDQKASSKDSDSSKSSDSSKDSHSNNGSDSSKDMDSDRIQQTQTAWMDAVKELREARAAEKQARHSEAETKAILEFLKKNVLLVGRSGDVPFADLFWSGGQGQDLSLRKAVDVAETQVGEVFANRPQAEASIREMLGLANLNLGDPARAVQQYERALALRESLQGDNGSATADCRNQLAVAYRLAGRTTEAGRLFDRNPRSADHVSALAVQGSMLLLQKKPSEAELKLRECLTLQEKSEPDNWTTYDTKSMLGQALLEQNRYAEAEPLLVSGYEGMKQREATIPSQDKSHLIKALDRIVKLYEAWGKLEEATNWRNQRENATITKKT